MDNYGIGIAVGMAINNHQQVSINNIIAMSGVCLVLILVIIYLIKR